jgi:DNA-binding beta-propeller fold protein YncE
VHVFGFAGGSWKETFSIPLNHNGVGLGILGILPVAADLDVTGDGKHLLVANYENDSVIAIHMTSHTVESELDLRPGIIDPGRTGQPRGTYPYWIAVKENDRAYVSSQRDREVVVLDLKALPALRVTGRIPLPGQPNKMILDRSGSRPFVAQDNTDSVAVIRTEDNKVISEIDTVAPQKVFHNPHKFKGAGPNSLALSPDEKWLYVTNGAQMLWP